MACERSYSRLILMIAMLLSTGNAALAQFGGIGALKEQMQERSFTKAATLLLTNDLPIVLDATTALPTVDTLPRWRVQAASAGRVCRYAEQATRAGRLCGERDGVLHRVFGAPSGAGRCLQTGAASGTCGAGCFDAAVAGDEGACAGAGG